MKTISINEVLNEVRNGKGLLKITLNDASRYSKNSRGKMDFNTDMWWKKDVDAQKGDEIIALRNKQINVSEIARILRSLVGCGDVTIWISGEQSYRVGEVVDDIIVKVSNEVYSALSDELIEQIGSDEYFKTTIEVEKDGIMYELEASGMVYRKEVRCPDWTGEVISDVIPTWWELHTFDKDGNEIRNDGQFSEIREYIIDYGKSW